MLRASGDGRGETAVRVASCSGAFANLRAKRGEEKDGGEEEDGEEEEGMVDERGFRSTGASVGVGTR